MDMNYVYRLNKACWEKVNAEDYQDEDDENRTIDLVNITQALLAYDGMRETEADEKTFGEFTRRFNTKMEELENLLKGD
jgi:hypothetical protein